MVLEQEEEEEEEETVSRVFISGRGVRGVRF